MENNSNLTFINNFTMVQKEKKFLYDDEIGKYTKS